MTRNNTIKIMAIATVFLSALPALIYYLYYLKSVRNNSSLISDRELGLFTAIALTATVSHIGVDFAASSVAVGGAFFMVSGFIHLTKIVALILFYKSCKTPDVIGVENR
jgi:hypothetical protein